MDLTINTAPTPTKSADSEYDTPRIQPVKSFSFTNGAVLNKHHHQPPPHVVVTYKECLKNHAASIGGHAVDGCGEFMPSSTANSTDPTSLKCAACGCHRNFHRREPDGYPSPTTTTRATHFLDFQRHPIAAPRRFSPSTSPTPQQQQQQPSYASHMLMALSTALHDDQQRMNNHHVVATPVTPTAMKGENPSERKRSRTKFTQEQKQKMHTFAENLGWKMQKSDAATVENFCNDIGVARGVLKVWMHNNKHNSGKKDINNNSISNMPDMNSNCIENGTLISLENNGYNINSSSNNDENKTSSSLCETENNNGDVHLHVSTNASSSST